MEKANAPEHKKASGKGLSSDLLKKHPKEVAIGIAAAIILIYAIKKNSANSSTTTAAAVDPTASTSSSPATGVAGSVDPATQSADLTNALLGLNSNLSQLLASPTVSTQGSSASVTPAITGSVDPGTIPLSGLLSTSDLQKLAGITSDQYPTPTPSVTLPKPTAVIPKPAAPSPYANLTPARANASLSGKSARGD